MGKYKLGIDVGGTFTDFFLVGDDGTSVMHKTLSTPEDSSVGFITGIKELAEKLGLPEDDFIRNIDTIVHGTTVATNALLTQNGAKTALITTKGFRDALEMRRGIREERYNNHYRNVEPMVPRRYRYTVDERIDAEGNSIKALDTTELDAIIEDIKAPSHSPTGGEQEPEYFTADPMLYGVLKERSEENRNNPTEAEKVAWELLRANKTGFHIRRQHIIGSYIVDFMNIKTKTVIEIDGDIHDCQQEEDAQRTKWLEEEGFEVIRFKNEKVIGEPDGFINEVKNTLIRREQTPSPMGRAGEGPSSPQRGDGRGVIEAVAVCFMNSYLNSEHEKQATEYLRQQLPELFICGSYEVLPSVRFYERVSTTCVNAYIGVVVERYLKSLLGKLEELNFEGKLLIMQSNGGVVTPEVACKIAAVTSLSGPAAAPIAGAYYAELLGYDNCITMDMGGTSFDASLVVNRQCVTSTDGEINRYRIALPTLDIVTIGAGGGSIGWIDSGGLLKMGPQSAGSLPGPISYDRGGEQPACTDADLLLGYLDPNFFAGGKYTLNQEKAEALTGQNLGEPLGMDAQNAAAGMYRVINMNMAQGVREVSVERGYDPREFLMICAGGAGSIHAGEICRELEIPMFVVPSVAPIFCAAGMLLGDLKHDYVRSYMTTLGNIDNEQFLQLYAEMKEEAIATLTEEGISESKIQYIPSLDLRYVGQYHEVPLEVSMEDILSVNTEAIKEAFHKEHNRQFGYELKEEGTELEAINIRLRAIGVTEKPESLSSPVEETATTLEATIKGKRKAYIPEADEMREVTVYDGDQLTGQFKIDGPAIIEQVNTTIVLGESYNCETGIGGAFIVYNKVLMPEGFQNKSQTEEIPA